MNKEQLQNLLNQKYDAANWNKIYGSIFPNVMLFSSPKEIAVTENWVKSFKQRGLVRLQGNQDVAIFEVVLKDGISVQSKRVGLRNLVAKLIDEYQNHGVLAVFDNGSPEYRFTFAAKETKVTREGIEKTETDSKRYTYILGETETCKTAAEQFIKLSEKGSTISLSDLQEAFSVEKLSKQFFNEYKEQYNYFVSYLASQPKILKSVFADDQKRMRDFIKLLLGRLVFLQFVQKKRWLGVPAKNTDWSSGDVKFLVNTYKAFPKKEKYYSDFLEELFFECLNSPNRKNELFSITGTKVPFLNGGLFENDNPKTKSINFPVSYFDGLFDFFGRYNFTIDENDPTEKEVGIDPEMLGSIFENLLEDNKDKGAFYTPKEIVHYMCQESLIEYLCTKVNVENDEKVASTIRNLITKRKIDECVTRLIKPIAVALREVKICDPAIGSGAFPMGMLMEIFHCVFELYNADPKAVSKEWNMNGWQANVVKSNIIQNSIYGVDIEKGAVDIARLRFWLSLIVDEEEPKALPNLDYKIVVGNSLVSKFENEIIEIDWEVKEGTQGNIFGNENLLKRTELLQAITKKQKQYFHPESNNKKKLSAEIRKLKIEILINQLELMINTKGLDKNASQSDKKFKEKNLAWNQTQVWKRNIIKLSELKKSDDDVFEHFDWKLDFPEILNPYLLPDETKRGFDIVIANPPYIGQKGNKSLFEPLSDDPNFEKKMDYWYFFLHKSYSLSKDSGVNTFITPNYWITTQGGKKLRKRIVENYSVIEYINFNENAIFEAGVHTNIFLLKKNELPNKNIRCTIYQNKYPETIFNYRRLELNFSANQNDILNPWTGFVHFLPENISSVINQLYVNCEKLSDNESEGENKTDSVAGKKITNGICNINQGIITGKDRFKDNEKGINEGVYVVTSAELKELNLSQKELDFIKPWVKNSDINKYFVSTELDYYIIYVDNVETEFEFNKLENIKKHLSKFKEPLSKRYINGVLQSAYKKGKWWALIHSVPIKIIKNQKIICPQRNRYNLFGFEEGETYASADVYYISLNKSEYSLKFILLILNSKLVYFWLYWMGKRKGEMLELYFEPLQFIPIKKANSKTQKQFEDMTDEIFLRKKSGESTSALEKQIDNMIYKLYELTYDEVKVIDPEFDLSKDEYDKIELK